MTHELKTWPEYFQAVLNGTKTFEVRKDDRPFKIGDILELQEWDNAKQQYTGLHFRVGVSYILKGGQFGIEHGFVVLGINPEC